jgi:Domain of unknown function (DUF4177)
MTRWHYDVSVIGLDPSIPDPKLNQLGEKGWELVTIIQVTDSKGRTEYRAIFKQPLPATSN